MRASGLELAPGIDGLRDQQIEALEWVMNRPEPYLFVNAPTGSGKTLLLATAGALIGKRWTYAVNTIALQEQVASTFTNLPVLTGRRNHPCWVGKEVYGVGGEYDAGQGVCVLDRGRCAHSSKPGDAQYRSIQHEGMCPYYAQLGLAMRAGQRVTNYAMLLSLPPLRESTSTLLADEGHNVEDAVVNAASVVLHDRTFRRFGVRVPFFTDMAEWGSWARGVRLPEPDPRGRPDFGLKTVREQVVALSGFTDRDQGQWLVEQVDGGVSFQPIWGRDFVMRDLFGHEEAPPNADAYEYAEYKAQGVRKVVLTSATLMGAEYIANTLGLPDGSWAYLDLPSTFPVANRPINFSPVTGMNYQSMQTAEGRKPMQDAIDRLIEYYVMNGRPSGVIHAVSNRYRDNILRESRWSGILSSSTAEHAAKLANGEASVLVAANAVEGWDGADDLCRFVIFPKIPFPSLGDKRTKIRQQEDPRSYDHKALVAVVQGAGRGVRHKEDYADTWILDSNWRQLYARRRSWLPESFVSAYHHNVALV